MLKHGCTQLWNVLNSMAKRAENVMTHRIVSDSESSKRGQVLPYSHRRVVLIRVGRKKKNLQVGHVRGFYANIKLDWVKVSRQIQVKYDEHHDKNEKLSEI